MTWARYVAIGDSFTEGLGDPPVAGAEGWRGWADRTAEALADLDPDFRYANLAIRGRLLGPIVDDQIPLALALKPDLVSLSGGGNDLLRPGANPTALAARLEQGVKELRAAGADVILFTGVDPAESPVISRMRPQMMEYNRAIKEIAARHGAYVVDQWEMGILRDWRCWAGDRIHLSPQGHRRVSLAVLEALGVPTAADWREPLPPRPDLSPGARRLWHLRWFATFLVPWIWRRLRGRSSGDLVDAKRPTLSSVRSLP